jgi:hypothetical protein
MAFKNTARARWRRRRFNGMLKRYQGVVQFVPNVQAVQTPTYFLPRDAGEDEGGGLNDWNELNDLNGRRKECHDSRGVKPLLTANYPPNA